MQRSDLNRTTNDTLRRRLWNGRLAGHAEAGRASSSPPIRRLEEAIELRYDSLSKTKHGFVETESNRHTRSSMSATELPISSERVERMRPVETSPGIKVYRAGSIMSRLVTEGTKDAAPESSSCSGKIHSGESKS
jgi:hypothetical protein